MKAPVQMLSGDAGSKAALVIGMLICLALFTSLNKQMATPAATKRRAA